jgi:hypothetical protein
VLSVYRDYIATQDDRFLADVWPAVEAALRHLQQFDRCGHQSGTGSVSYGQMLTKARFDCSNKDGMIENAGLPDQTYHSWMYAIAFTPSCEMAQGCILAALLQCDGSERLQWRSVGGGAQRG